MFDLIICLIWVAVILGTIPYGNKIGNGLAHYIPPPTITKILLVFVLISFILFIRHTIKNIKTHRLRKAIIGTVIFLVYAYLFKTLTVMVEKLHFFEYGILSYLFVRVLSKKHNDDTIYLFALALVYFIGLTDETIQWIFPKRTGEYKDVVFNAMGGLLPLVSLRYVFSFPASIEHRFDVKKLVKFLYAIVIFIPLTGVFIEGTTTYGYGYIFSNITFQSRLTPEKLKIENNSSNRESLIKFGGMKYGDFLKKFDSKTHPYLYECRVHLFRRDYYVSRKNDPWISYSENRILEKYFSSVIKNTSFAWDNDKIKEIGARIPPGQSKEHYYSPVSQELITRFTMFEFRFFLGVLMLLDIIIIFILKKMSNVK